MAEGGGVRVCVGEGVRVGRGVRVGAWVAVAAGVDGGVGVAVGGVQLEIAKAAKARAIARERGAAGMDSRTIIAVSHGSGSVRRMKSHNDPTRLTLSTGLLFGGEASFEPFGYSRILMRPFDLERSMSEAEQRLPPRPEGTARRPRSDAGKSRLPDAVVGALLKMMRRQERPPMREMLDEIAEVCRQIRETTPSRATIYRFMAQCPPRQVRIADLPDSVRETLYNLDHNGLVPGHQLAFYAFSFGDMRALSFATGLPWPDLYQADRMRGWPPDRTL